MMPSKPPKLKPAASTRSRRSTTRWQHLYASHRWRRASERFRASPEGALCIDCRARGVITPSAITDHIVPHCGNLDLFWDPRNFAPRCWGCHSAKTRSDQTGKPRRGCDQDGVPLDRNHHWHREREA
jgi:5-methylcytosine-specific restriction protein A